MSALTATPETVTITAAMLEDPELKAVLLRLNSEAQAKDDAKWESFFFVPCLGNSFPLVGILEMAAATMSTPVSLHKGSHVAREQGLPFHIYTECKAVIDEALPDLKWSWANVAELIEKHSA